MVVLVSCRSDNIHILYGLINKIYLTYNRVFFGDVIEKSDIYAAAFFLVGI